MCRWESHSEVIRAHARGILSMLCYAMLCHVMPCDAVGPKASTLQSPARGTLPKLNVQMNGILSKPGRRGGVEKAHRHD